DGLKKYLRAWQEQIEKDLRGELEEHAAPAKYEGLNQPYHGLLSHSQKIYRISDTFSFRSNNGAEIEGIDPEDLLLKSSTILGWVDTSTDNAFAKAPVYYLRADDPFDQFHAVKYFALPLSMDGLQLFLAHIGDQGLDNVEKFKLSAKVTELGKLAVELTILVDKSPYKVNREYEIEYQSQDKSLENQHGKVIMWPNFVSDYWQAYYFFTQFPLNLPGKRFVPFYKSCQESKLVTATIQKGDSVTYPVVYADSDPTLLENAQLHVKKLVNYPVEQQLNLQKYEIVKSNKPIAGLEIRLNQNLIGGYLVVKIP
ncbi:hypothetical protein RZS08_07030, partial [Arthrospira platensis SPKY1]|nr:hypothetical protein [Arthrospira platensis SPKY1]